VLAGQVSVGRREAAAVGVDAAFGVAEHAGSVEASMADPAGTLAALAEQVARQWSKS
jgi:glycerate 2-kinase